MDSLRITHVFLFYRVSRLMTREIKGCFQVSSPLILGRVVKTKGKGG
jgi:hypothetical protein